MKPIYKYLKLLLLLMIICISIPTEAKTEKPAWTQPLNVNASVSSSIAQVEDGVVVMQYEGADSNNNLLIKYGFEGQKVWEISNTYGYNIESVSDGFIVWSETKITKFDKEKNIIWSKDIEFITGGWENYGGLGNILTETSDGYIIYSTGKYDRTRDVIYIDFEGNIKRRIKQDDLIESMEVKGYYCNPVVIVQSLDGNNLIVVMHEHGTGVDNLIIGIFDNDFNFKKGYSSSFIGKDNLRTDYARNIVETEDLYIIYGEQIFIFNKSGIFINAIDKISLDIKAIGDYIYSYSLEQTEENSDTYKTYLIKYDKKMEEVSKMELPLTFKMNIMTIEDIAVNNFNKFVYYNYNEQLNITLINTPLTYIYEEDEDGSINYYQPSSDYLDSEYKLINYRFKYEDNDQKTDDNKNDENNNSGIISNVFKNPETNSIIIISVFLLLILVITFSSYVVYKKRLKNKL